MMQATVKIKKQVEETRWSEFEGKWHNVVKLRIVCNQRYVLGDMSQYDDIDQDRVCEVCWERLESVKIGLGVEDVKFNLRVFGNERMLLILRKLKDGDKRFSEMKDLIKGTGKRHMNFELTRLLENELIEKDGIYYRLTKKGVVGEFIGSLILDLRDIDDVGLDKIVGRIQGDVEK